MIKKYNARNKSPLPRRHKTIGKRHVVENKKTNDYEIFAYCSENYKDAYDFVIDSWSRTFASKITIYTDFDLKCKNKKVKIIKLFEPSDDWITGTGRRLDVIKHFNNSLNGENRNVLFLDIDCYIIRDVGEVFSHNFDIAITRLFSNEAYSNRTATAGLWFAKTTSEYFKFIDDWIKLADKYKKKNKGMIKHHISYVQYSFTDIARKYLKFHPNVVFPIDEKIYNSEHTILQSWLDLIVKNHPSILHFKGRRFRNLSLVKKVLKNAGDNDGKSKDIIRVGRSRMGVRFKRK